MFIACVDLVVDKSLVAETCNLISFANPSFALAPIQHWIQHNLALDNNLGKNNRHELVLDIQVKAHVTRKSYSSSTRHDTKIHCVYFQYQLLSCCVFSEEPITNHQSKVMEVMNDHNWTNTEGVKHFCACHPGPNSKLRKRDIENSSFAKAYRLLGVPTLVLIDSEGKTSLMPDSYQYINRCRLN